MGRKRLALLFLGLVFILLFAGPVFAVPDGTQDAQTTENLEQTGDSHIQKDAQGLPVINTGTGLPPVTEDMVVKKVWRMVGRLYNMVAQIAPHITLGVLVIGVLAGIFFESARNMIKWAILGLVIILWGPQLLSLLINLISA